jgi:signal transduction histidine kinase
MRKPLHTFLAFAISLGVVLAGIGWISVTVVRLDRAEAEARKAAVVEESVRLALWRMDSAVAPIVARETARPYFAYQAFYPAERAYTRMFNEIGQGEILVPSPLLTRPTERVLLHFQVSPDGVVSSPQIPSGNQRDLAEMRWASHEAIEQGAGRLEMLRPVLSRARLLGALKAPILLADAKGPNAPAQPASQLGNQGEVQVQKSSAEWQARSKSVMQSVYASNSVANAPEQNAPLSKDYKQKVVALPPRPEANPGELAEGAMAAVWVDDKLLLLRRIRVQGGEWIQGAWLDWDSLRAFLEGEVKDLLPGARLEPWREPGVTERLLASLPVHLVPGPVAASADAEPSPVPFILGVAWSGVILAVLAVALLLAGTLLLSERRAAFVSAVTHELRTPLTTFRMYTDMLAAGMVPDEAAKRTYLDTLQREAVRLSHLVENVLAYGRVERGRKPGKAAAIRLAELLERIRPRLAERAEQAGMALEVACDDLVVRAEPAAFEQILFNLVDNACKYAAPATDRRIHLTARAAGRRAALSVRDHGPGVVAADRHMLFVPFGKPAERAATSAPGVGLGLALCRQLARSLGGELKYREAEGGGAEMVLTLRRV